MVTAGMRNTIMRLNVSAIPLDETHTHTEEGNRSLLRVSDECFLNLGLKLLCIVYKFYKYSADSKENFHSLSR